MLVHRPTKIVHVDLRIVARIDVPKKFHDEAFSALHAFMQYTPRTCEAHECTKSDCRDGTGVCPARAAAVHCTLCRTDSGGNREFGGYERAMVVVSVAPGGVADSFARQCNRNQRIADLVGV